ncbi:dystroglycan 1-like isoform X2 [Ornithodoros turicata]
MTVPHGRLSWTLFLVTIVIRQVAGAMSQDGAVMDVQGILQELDNRVQETDGESQECGVRRHWGVPDTTAAAGRLFNYTIPSDAFTGPVARFEVTEAGEGTLPKWLHFIESTRTLVGVPLDTDIGQHYISVKAISQHSNELTDRNSVAKDVFSIDVLEEPQTFQGATNMNDLNQPEPTKCPSTEPVTLATVIVDVDVTSLEPPSRALLLGHFLRFLSLPTHAVRLVAMASDSHAYDDSAIMAGPGDALQRYSAGAQLQWRVGCGSSVDSAHAAGLQKLEPAARHGELAKELGHKVVGWHVTSVQPRSTRRKRARAEAFYGATPIPGLPPIRPSTTEHVTEATENFGGTPESRIIPSMSSPSFGAPSHHHRHHHGDHGLRSHHAHHQQFEGLQITASPVATHHYLLPTSAPGYTPPLPPMRPTRLTSSVGWLEPSRSVPQEVTPTFTHEFMPPVATSDFVIEPSRTIDVPVESTKTPEAPKKPSGLNSKPSLDKRIKKLVMTAGKVWSYQIPADTFLDFEDGDTRNLNLMFLTSAGTAIEPRSWIQFDPEEQTLFALPLDENIGKYSFKLEAMDREGASVHDMLDINVWQHSGARVIHHKFHIGVRPKKFTYVNTIEWQIATVKRLAQFYGDKDESQITVLAATLKPMTITWTNDSLPTHPCPRDSIDALYSKMVVNKSTNAVARPFHKALGNLSVHEASVEYIGVCQTSAPSPPPIPNTPPEKRNAIGQINATVGEILRFKIPEDTFFDSRDGITPFLKLSFLTMDNMHLPESSWIQFNPKTQELYGLPFDADVRRYEFQMVALDNEGSSVSDVFVVVVHPRSQKKWAVEFSLHIDEDFKAFNHNISRKVLVAWKLARLFGDHDPRYITVSSISAGSVVYAWTNNTLPYEPCPTTTIRRLMSYLVNDNRTLTQRLVEEMKPEFHILKTDTMPLGLCLDQGLPTTSVVNTEAAPPAVDPDVTPSDDDIYITTIIPAVVIAVMLLLAAIVACFLYRKKRKGKMTMQDSSTFINKGIPIIFADELDDKPDPAKPPVIMKEERPPLPPPEYPRSVGSSRGSTPQTDRRRAAVPLRDAPYQQPTPPFVASRDSKHSRPKAAPTYRQPPPYVPP